MDAGAGNCQTAAMRTVSDPAAMIAGMTPRPEGGDYVFCTVAEGDWPALAPLATGMFREAEGMSAILPLDVAQARGFDCTQPMRRITLGVYSALEGVGLTAAVAGALARAGIPCNVVAAFHHDHIFVPAGMADRALAVLRAVQAGG